MNRQPQAEFRKLLGQHVLKWLQTPGDEADIEFERQLLNLGVIRSDETVEQIEGGNAIVFITTEDGAYISIDIDGRVTEEQ